MASLGVVHGDLAPTNVLLCVPWDVVVSPSTLCRWTASAVDTSPVAIIDLGAAYKLDDGPPPALTTGVSGYYDEQAVVASFASDIYAFACVAVFVLAGAKPSVLVAGAEEDGSGVSREMAMEAWREVNMDEPDLCRVLLRCFADEEEDRPTWDSICSIFEAVAQVEDDAEE